MNDFVLKHEYTEVSNLNRITVCTSYKHTNSHTKLLAWIVKSIEQVFYRFYYSNQKSDFTACKLNLLCQYCSKLLVQYWQCPYRLRSLAAPLM